MSVTMFIYMRVNVVLQAVMVTLKAANCSLLGGNSGAGNRLCV